MQQADAAAASNLDYVEYGDADVIFYDGIARIDLQNGNVVFALWRWVTTVIDGRFERRKTVIKYMATSIASVQDGVGQLIELLGPRDALVSLQPEHTDRMLV
jgi:hypothetical protein